MTSQENMIIVEGFRKPEEVIDDESLSYDDKLRILEKWNQILTIKSQVFPNQAEGLGAARIKVISFVNQLAKKHMLLQDQEVFFD